ncbi:MAG: hypothetical protein QG608_3392 [Actinomycetota bacterium]|nr:hypothetical protein [Actinomycetota bacterium]
MLVMRRGHLRLVRFLPAVDPEEPTPADLDRIENEWPLIAAELAVVDAEIAIAVAGEHVCELDRARLRRAQRQVLQVAAELRTLRIRSLRGTERTNGGEAA